MRYPINLSLYFLVLLALLLALTPAGNTASQSRQSSGAKMSPEAWPPGDLEKYWRLQRDFRRPHPAVESARGMVAVTHDAISARIGLEALQQGASAADAALATSLAQIALDAGAPTSYAGVLTMIYSEKVYRYSQFHGTVLWKSHWR